MEATGEKAHASADVEVIVVGAGAAGLTAAYHLQKAGLTVKVLEATEQFGGRVRKDDTLADFPVDLGAGWIHGNPRKILNAILDEDVASRKETVLHYTGWMHLWTGKRFVRFPTLPSNAWGWKFVNGSWYDFFNDELVAKLHSGTLVLGSPVASVDYSCRESGDLDGKVKVMCENGEAYCCSYVIVTASMKLLQKNAIVVTPALPTRIRRAISHFRMGLAVKVVMKFSETFWPQKFVIGKDLGKYSYFRESSTNYAERDFWDETFGQKDASDCHLLGMYCYGRICQQYLDLFKDGGKQAIVDALLSELDAMFDGKATGCHERTIVTLWPTEKYVQTGFTHWTNAEEIYELQGAVGKRLLFAGEAIPPDRDSWGFAHTAALSGKDAARKVVELKTTGSYTPTIATGCGVCSVS
ncbi:hypothetical protein ACHAXT_004580 [Thalassiosira profunda]